MSDVTDKLNQVVSDVQGVVNELQVQPVATPSVSDKVVKDVVAALVSAGYTVTAPEVESASEDVTESSEEVPQV